MKELIAIQQELKTPKNQYNKFGKYNYRNCEDILEAVKPLLAKNNTQLVVSDEIVEIGGRVYVKATATLQSGDVIVFACGFAREPETQKGMNDSQITGSSSSYARKYALNGLFLIDDTKDADTMDNRPAQQQQTEPKIANAGIIKAIHDCGKEYANATKGDWKTICGEWVKHYSDTRTTNSKELYQNEASALLNYIKSMLQEAK